MKKLALILSSSLFVQMNGMQDRIADLALQIHSMQEHYSQETVQNNALEKELFAVKTENVALKEQVQNTQENAKEKEALLEEQSNIFIKHGQALEQQLEETKAWNEELQETIYQLSSQIDKHEHEVITAMLKVANMLGVRLLKCDYNKRPYGDYAIVKEDGKIYFTRWFDRSKNQGLLESGVGKTFSTDMKILYDGNSK